MIKKIILDTNFLVDSLKFKIDIFSELRRILDVNYEIFVLDKTLEELKKIKKEKLILKLVEEYNVGIIETDEGTVDDLIVDLVNENYIVCTNDSELKKRVKEKKLSIITIRQKKYYKLD